MPAGHWKSVSTIPVLQTNVKGPIPLIPFPRGRGKRKWEIASEAHPQTPARGRGPSGLPLSDETGVRSAGDDTAKGSTGGQTQRSLQEGLCPLGSPSSTTSAAKRMEVVLRHILRLLPEGGTPLDSPFQTRRGCSLPEVILPRTRPEGKPTDLWRRDFAPLDSPSSTASAARRQEFALRASAQTPAKGAEPLWIPLPHCGRDGVSLKRRVLPNPLRFAHLPIEQLPETETFDIATPAVLCCAILKATVRAAGMI